MNCHQMIELLPWWLNATLEEGERQEVQEHLASCASCRAALAETRQAWQIFGQHVPAADLVAHAWGEAPSTIAPELLAQHLETCPECAAELELARMSRHLEEDDRIAVFQPQPRPASFKIWRSSALAASLVGIVALSGWIQSADRVRSLEEERRRTAAISAPAEPQLNAWAEQLEPSSPIERGETEVQEIREIPAGRPAVLVLPTSEEHAPELHTTHGLELRNRERIVWRKESGLERAPGRDEYGITFPAGFLEPGLYTLQVFATENGRRVDLERYQVRVLQ